jgi:hypothetical protein
VPNDCEKKDCKRRFYSFESVGLKYRYDLTEWSLPPTPEAKMDEEGRLIVRFVWPDRKPIGPQTLNATQRADAEKSINADLKRFEDIGESISSCDSPCKCPKIDKPALGGPPWPNDYDEVTKYTTFSTGGVEYVIWFRVKQKTTDVTRGCILDPQPLNGLPQTK